MLKILFFVTLLLDLCSLKDFNLFRLDQNLVDVSYFKKNVLLKSSIDLKQYLKLTF